MIEIGRFVDAVCFIDVDVPFDLVVSYACVELEKFFSSM
jgi:hypothetical protein